MLLVTVDGITHELEGGDFCLIQPGNIHTLQGLTSTITPFAHMDIFFHPEREQSFPTKDGQIDLTPYRHLLQPRLNDIQGIHVPVHFQPKQPIQFRDKMLEMVHYWQNPDSIQQLKSQSLATELVLTLLEEHSLDRKMTGSSVQSLNWITSYISFYLSEPISVKEMAQRAHLSPTRFNVVFQEKFGMPPHRYLMKVRIKHAQELLRTTSLNLQDVAAYCGFADIHHFSKAFKKDVGMAPSAYRIREAQEKE